MRLLVVEDDPDLNRQLTTALSDAGYVVDRAFDGEEGHFLGDSEPYDAIVLIARERAGDDLLRRALTPLIDRIPLALMQEANYRVDRERDKETPAATARWLESELAGRSN